MSEQSKGILAATSTNKPVKNPLLMNNVTNVSFEPFLLTAAPPIIQPVLREPPKSLVTVGASSGIDTENLDEINLNSNQEEPPACIDTNSNPLLEQAPLNSDSILSQAASSFSALPSVASSVFSTFSKRIYSGSNSRELTPDTTEQDTNSNFITQPFQTGILPPTATPPSFQAAYTPNSNIIQAAATPTVDSGISYYEAPQPITPAEPPKFYTPSELPNLSAAPVAPPTSVGNNFRLAAKKKIYAPIPGLTDQAAAAQQQPPTVDHFAVNAPFALNPPQQVNPNFDYQQAENSYYQPTTVPAQEQKKGGLFSLTNLVPTGVLQNISGLVQSAAGTLTQSVRPEATNSPPQQSSYYQTPENQTASVDINFFGSNSQSSQASNYFVPPAAPQQFSAAPSAVPAFVPPPTGFYNPASLPTVAAVPNRPPSVPIAIERPPSATSTNVPLQTSTTPFNPTSNLGGITLFNPNEVTATVHNQNQIFPPTTNPPLAAVNPPPTFGVTTQPTSAVFPPPSLSTTTEATASVIPPPSQGSTFRLQKGTRHYKSPFTNDELISQAPEAIFNPFAAQQDPQGIASTVAAVPNYFVPQSSETQSVSLFAPASEEEPTQQLPSSSLFTPISDTTKEQNQQESHLGIPPPSSLFATHSAEINQQELTAPPQAVSQFFPTSAISQQETQIGVPTSTSTQSVSLFAPQTAESLNQPQLGLASTQSISPFASPFQGEPQQQQSVSTAQQEVQLEGTHSANSSSLFAPSLNEEKPQLHSVPLFSDISQPTSTTNQPQFEIPLFAPPPTEQIQPTQSVFEEISKSDLNTLNQTEQQLGIPPPISGQSSAALFPPQPFAATTNIANQQDSQLVSSQNLPPFGTSAEDIKSNEGVSFGGTQISTNSAAAQSIDKLSLEPEKTSSLSNFLPPPPLNQTTTTPAQANPYRKDIPAASTNPTTAVAPSLANFFQPAATDVSSSADFNFFATAPPASYFPEPSNLIPALPETASQINPIALGKENTFLESEVDNSIAASGIPPPLGFDNIVSNSTAVVSSIIPVANTTTTTTTPFSTYFNQTSNNPKTSTDLSTKLTKLPDATSFFDNFAAAPTAPAGIATNREEQQKQGIEAAAAKEDLLIQNFFNNPPPKENSSGVGDLNYDLVHRGLAVKNLETRSQTPISNVVEPASSSCSEWSELNNSRKLGNQIAADSVLEKNIHSRDSPDFDSITTKHYSDLPEEVLKTLRMAHQTVATSEKATTVASLTYAPAVKHWFYKRPVGTKHVWTPFSHLDSALLETSFIAQDQSIVAVEGGRYDVNIQERIKTSVYWEGTPIEVRRCSWFFKGIDSKYIPYEEETADRLENEYKQAVNSGEWHKKIILSMGEQVVFHAPTVIVHFQQQQNVDAWGGTSQTSSRPRVVKRDLEDFIIDQGESQHVDHLLLMIHGVGSACDLKLRTLEEVVDDFRNIALQLVQSHYKNSTDMGTVSRVEVLPISWHSDLHSEEMGIDEQLKSITLESIPKLRNFTNDTLLDILFYTSPLYCQKIMNTVVGSMNSVYQKYRERHPDFNGGVSVAGHSLGSLILFDLLCHQKPLKESDEENLENPNQMFVSASADVDSNLSPGSVSSQQISYAKGNAGTGQPFIHYEQLKFQPKKFFALGSPIGMFVTVRGIDKLGLDFRLPTCPSFYNIFHPFDPVAYRLEALVNPDMSGIRPVLIPHHKGRKRMHLELKETMTRVGADLKQRFFDTFKSTLDSVNFLGVGTRSKKEQDESMEQEVGKVLELQMQLDKQQEELQQQGVSNPLSRSRANSTCTSHSDTDIVELDLPLGKLNDSKRIDYVLQEAPLEFFNEYLFAMSSHVCYWESEDTILFVMKEIYNGLGISPDSQVPQQTMTIERPSSRNGTQQLNVNISPPS